MRNCYGCRRRCPTTSSCSTPSTARWTRPRSAGRGPGRPVMNSGCGCVTTTGGGIRAGWLATSIRNSSWRTGHGTGRAAWTRCRGWTPLMCNGCPGGCMSSRRTSWWCRCRTRWETATGRRRWRRYCWQAGSAAGGPGHRAWIPALARTGCGKGAPAVGRRHRRRGGGPAKAGTRPALSVNERPQSSPALRTLVLDRHRLPPPHRDRRRPGGDLEALGGYLAERVRTPVGSAPRSRCPCRR